MQIAKKSGKPTQLPPRAELSRALSGCLTPSLRWDIVGPSSRYYPRTESSYITLIMSHEDRFIPERQKLDQLGVVKDYAVHPRLDYR